MVRHSNNRKASCLRFFISSCFCVSAVVLPFQYSQAQNSGETAVIELNRPEPQNNLPAQGKTQVHENLNSGTTQTTQQASPQNSTAQNNTETDPTSTGSIQNDSTGTAAVKQDTSEQTGTLVQPKNQAQQGNSGQQNQSASENKPKTNEQQPVAQTTGVEKSDGQKSLTLASWGGAYAAAQEVTFLAPFSEAEKLRTRLDQHDHKSETINSRLGSSDSNWDVIDLSHGALEKACSAGLLETIDPSILTAGPGGPVQSDFIDGSLKSCGIGTMAWSSTIIYNTRVFTKKKLPQTAKDFFNVKSFKGQRALPRQPEYVLELALLADGVAAPEVYNLLATEAGIERAFKRLDTIKKNISWTSDPSEPLKLVKEGKAALGLAYTGQIFSSITKDQSSIAMIWDGQIYNINYLAVAKNSKNKAEAMKFISYATTPERLARQASWFPYGPTRRSALSLIGKHPEAGIEVNRYVPTQEARMKTALLHDQVWWQTHKEDLQDRFQKWLNGEPYLKKPDVTETPDQQTNTNQNNVQQTNTTTQTTQGVKPQ